MGLDQATGSSGINRSGRLANATHDVTVTGATGTAVTVPISAMMLVYCDGTDCRAFAVDASGTVTSVVGQSGAGDLAQLVSGGVMPTNNATPTGTMDASGATAVKVPTVTAGDNSTNAASTAFVATGFAPLASRP